VTGNESDDLFLAQADFAQSTRHFGRGAKFFDPDRRSGFDAIQRTQGTISFVRPKGDRSIHQLHIAYNIAVSGAARCALFAIRTSYFARLMLP
jgi:hypothetical protein